MRKLSLSQLKKRLNLKRFLKLVDPGNIIETRTCRSGIFESAMLSSCGEIFLGMIKSTDIQKLYKIRKLEFEDPYSISHVFDIKLMTSNFKLIKELNFINKKKNIHFFLECLYSKLNKTYYITIEDYYKLNDPGDDFIFKSKSKAKCLVALDNLKKKLLKINKEGYFFKI